MADGQQNPSQVEYGGRDVPWGERAPGQRVAREGSPLDGRYVVAVPGHDLSFPEVLPPILPERVELAVDVETAKVLIQILRRVSGDPSGPRGKVDNLLRALRVTGLEQNAKYVTPGWKWEGGICIVEIAREKSYSKAAVRLVK